MPQILEAVRHVKLLPGTSNQQDILEIPSPLNLEFPLTQVTGVDTVAVHRREWWANRRRSHGRLGTRVWPGEPETASCNAATERGADDGRRGDRTLAAGFEGCEGWNTYPGGDSVEECPADASGVPQAVGRGGRLVHRRGLRPSASTRVGEGGRARRKLEICPPWKRASLVCP
jgi:hypothetical protein